MRGRLHAVLLLSLACTASVSCGKRDPIATLRDALATGDASKLADAERAAPTCESDAPGTPRGRAPDECLTRAARAFGSKTRFQLDPPDQASAATAALFTMRHRGEQVPTPEAWLYTIREGAGPGADALRLAVAARMAEEAPGFARALDGETDARSLMRAVAASFPGACATYALLGAGTDEAKLPPETTADHSPCVQKDLDRPTGPQEHGRYGFGAWRGAEGALALWRDAATALHAGAAMADASVRPPLAAKVATIDAALGKIATKKLPPPPDLSRFMSEVHEAPARAAPSSSASSRRMTAPPGASRRASP